MTRIDSRTGLPYDVSGHLVWIGERTRDLDGAHVEFAASIRNPIGVKLGPTTTPDDALALIERLDPDREPGRLTFVTRMGAGKVRDAPAAAGREGHRERRRRGVGLRPDARQHLRGAGGLKTRRFDDVIDEVRGFFEVHRALGTHPGRHPHGAHRRRRDRVHRRLRRADREIDLPSATRRPATRG